MYGYVQTIIVVILIIAIVALLIGLIMTYNTKDTETEEIAECNRDFNKFRSIIVDDARLQRLLMIEIINDSQGAMDGNSKSCHSVTYNELSEKHHLLGKILAKYFGAVIGQKIVTLLQRRNEIVLDYYREMRNVVCEKDNCVHVSELENEEDSLLVYPNPIITPLFPKDNNKQIGGKDITTKTLTRLEKISKEISDDIAMVFQLKDVDSSKLVPLSNYQRIYNLLTMYDREIVNQSKAYASRQYSISMNFSKSQHEICDSLSDEFIGLMRHSHKHLKQ